MGVIVFFLGGGFCWKMFWIGFGIFLMSVVVVELGLRLVGVIFLLNMVDWELYMLVFL